MSSQPEGRETLLALDPAELEARVVALGGQPFHARIIRREVFGRGVLAYDDMTSLSAPLRARLSEELPVLAGVELERRVAPDGTTKLLIGLPKVPGIAATATGAVAATGAAAGQEATVEAVHIPSLKRASGKGATLCVSTQVGCPVACPFCASGLLGLTRNLAAHEILEQYVRGRALGPLSRSVVMGIGEPLLNYAALRAALDVVHGEMGLGARRITVSTVGFPERVRRAAQSAPAHELAISLHTAFDEQRDELVPAMRGVPIEDVLAAGDDWFAATGREVTYEIVLMAGVTDTPAHARELARRLAGRRCTVNLIPFNAVAESPYRRPLAEDVHHFRQDLEDAGLVATVRWSRGLEHDAACGQLRARAAR
jgi:23S rRNA (adenine2503-C2)-methyltransferase